MKVTFFGYNDNLHAVWDTYMISDLLKWNYSGSQDAWAQDLLVRVWRGQWATDHESPLLISPVRAP